MKRITIHLFFVAILLVVSCQKAPELALTSPTSIEVDANGGTSNISFTANRDWTVRSSELWVTVSPSSGSVSDDGTATVKVNCTANTTYEPRSATVTITVEDFTQTVTVNQPANLGLIVPNKLFELSGPGTITVEVQSNVQYKVSISNNWISFVETKGLMTDKLVFNVEANDTYEARSATITIKALEGKMVEQVITVKQAQNYAILIENKNYEMPYGGGEIQVNVQANVEFDVNPNVEWIHYIGTKALNNSTVRLVVDANGTYNARKGIVRFSQRNGSVSYEITVIQAGRTAVDLGLPSGLMWATCNLGASKPEEYGDYYAWGETETKSKYDWSTYKWCNGSVYNTYKYNTSSSYGTVDNRTMLESSDDVAHVKLGDKWRMPTDEEWTELRTKCSWTWTTQNGVYGRKITGPNGNSIFLPAAGDRGGTSLNGAGSYGYYWSSSLDTDNPYCAWCVLFDFWNVYRDNLHRYFGMSVRPVYVFVPVTGVSLNTTSLSLTEGGDTYTLTVTVSPSNATDKSVTWSSSNTSVATVSNSGVVTAVKAGSATITVKTNNGGKTATCAVTVKAASSGQEAVDLGLPSGLKWGSCNIGASKPEEYGDYYAWGETETKSKYEWSTYKWCNGSSNSLTKYNTLSSYGTVDNKTKLENSDDVARVKLGGKWRMPTDAEWTELRTKCSWTWTTQNGVEGRKVTGPNGKSIFLPAAGGRNGTSLYHASSLGYYWSSSLNTDYPYSAWRVYFHSGEVGRNYGSRCNGFSVRPVSE